MFRIVTAIAFAFCLLVGCNSSRQKDIVSIAGGRVESDVTAGTAKATEAAKSALLAHRQSIVQYSATDTRGRIIAYTLTNQRIEIDVTSQGKGLSHISIQTAGQGGEQISMILMQDTRNSL